MKAPLLPQGGTPYDSLLRQTLSRWFAAFEQWIAPITLRRIGATGAQAALPGDAAALTLGSGATYAPAAGVTQYVASGTTGSRMVLQVAGAPVLVAQVEGATGYIDAVGGSLQFRRGPTYIESMRIDANGRVSINGVPASDSRSHVTYVIGAEEGAAFNATGSFVQSWPLVFRVNGTVAGSVTHTAASTTTYATSSDRRLKAGIADAPPALATVAALRVRSFDWRDGSGHVSHSFVAQELALVFPDAVTMGGDDGTGDDLPARVMPWGMDSSKLVPLLVRAVQEQQQQIAALTAAVNGKG